MMKILLHTCCAPCLIYPLKKLREEGFEASAIFYNPNIHPWAEYQRRRDAVEAWAKQENCAVAYPEYRPEEFFQAINLQEALPGRCALCWRLRLEKTAQAAKEAGCDYFSSTLLVSPYQDQEKLKQIGTEAALGAGIKFYYADFRPGFREAHTQAKAKGIYCQKYCGCIYSEIEK